ncbi:glycoside hydrolase family 127 protein [Sphingobacterium chuzhouense]|uniref:Glycoside hydrolase family 127 protein n=1 Tax=Sphingobacterium chuzhouense TaxID=1742264 RepID=A0ABR7XTN3_9SPHI|nr:glycoside hydrolase family 127 protein [Sphingobacterium chuzhouense]MBD1422529.1 glycoside hydrolase family 127 protein [Sphingobacterium chuzhouense]
MKLKKLISICLLSTAIGTVLQAQTQKQIDYFELRDVRLLPSPFKHAEELDLNYLLELDADRLLTPFLREANLPSPTESYGNWENTGLDGHIGGHYVSALSHMYASTGDSRIKERLDHMLRNLKRCQDANGDGYIGGVPEGKELWEEVKRGKIKAGGFSLNERWVPLYNIHKTYAGLRDAYLLTSDEMAKEMLVKMTDWAIALVEGLSEEQIQDMLRSEHGGLNETFADVAAITQNPKYLVLAKQFSQKAVLNPLLAHEDYLTGKHANTQIPKVLGFKRIADLFEDDQWADAARYFWENVIERRSVSIGGNSVSEHFNPVDDFSKMIQSIEGPETCNTYNMLRLTRMLYQTDPKSKYLDYYERALYNHILSTQNPETGGLVYFTQMRPGHYRVYSQPHTSMWCCVGSGIENHAKYGEMIYAHSGDDLFVNLFIPSTLNWQEKNVKLVQENNFPTENKIQFTVHPKSATSFALRIRKPGWLAGEPVVQLNGKPYDAIPSEEGWITIERQWEKSDRVSVELPMHIHTEQLPDRSNYYSILYGPLVLAATTSTEDLAGLFADDSRMGHVARGRQIPLRDMPILTTRPDNIPNLVKRVDNGLLRFKLSGLRLGKEQLSMELEPFYKTHEARYIIYWPQATEEELAALQEKTEREERESLRLAGITIDRVVSGEQQPESDHFIKEENTQAGSIEDVRWREAKGWFSYAVKTDPKENVQLFIRYLDEENRKTNVLINDKEIGKLPQDNLGSGEVKTAVIAIPPNSNKAATFQVKIAADTPSTSHKILEIRIIKAD